MSMVEKLQTQAHQPPSRWIDETARTACSATPTGRARKIGNGLDSTSFYSRGRVVRALHCTILKSI